MRWHGHHLWVPSSRLELSDSRICSFMTSSSIIIAVSGNVISLFFRHVGRMAHAAKQSVGRACGPVIHFRDTARTVGITLSVTFGACVLLLQELPNAIGLWMS